MKDFILRESALGVIVVCSACQKELDKVPDRRTAYLRAGEYGRHECLNATPPSFSPMTK